jgi:hypothetical protein
MTANRLAALPCWIGKQMRGMSQAISRLSLGVEGAQLRFEQNTVIQYWYIASYRPHEFCLHT